MQRGDARLSGCSNYMSGGFLSRPRNRMESTGATWQQAYNSCTRATDRFNGYWSNDFCRRSKRFAFGALVCN